MGKCCEAGKEAGDSGTARIDADIDNETVAKLAYYYTYKQNWLDNSSIHPDYTAFTYGQLFAFAIQYAYQGESAYRAGSSSAFSDDVVERTITTIKGMIRTCQDTSVPAGFEILHCKTSSDVQDFIIWRLKPTGPLKLKKSSANTAITG